MWKMVILDSDLVNKIKNWKWRPLLFTLLWLSAIFIFVYWGCDKLFEGIDFFKKWMVSAIFITLFSSTLLYISMLFSIDEIAKQSETPISSNIKSIILMTTLMGIIPLIIILLMIKFFQFDLAHIGVGLLMSVTYGVTDWKFSKIDKKNQLKYKYTCWVADIPNIIGFLVILLIFIITTKSYPEIGMGPFLSGAIAFQLITSGVAFAAVEQMEVLEVLRQPQNNL